MAHRHLVWMVVAAACSPAASAPARPTQSFSCETAHAVLAKALAVRDDGRPRESLPEIERADKLCRTPASLAARRDVYEQLGRAESLEELLADARSDTSVRGALDRVKAAPHGVAAADALVTRARGESDPRRARALFEHARDELERATRTAGTRLSFAGMPTQIEVNGKWLVPSFEEGMLLRTDTWSALHLKPAWIDATASYAWVAAGDHDEQDLYSLEDVTKVLEQRVATNQKTVANMLVWTEQDTLHVFDRAARTERSHPLAGLSGDGISVTPDGKLLVWSTERAVHVYDPTNDHEDVHVEAGLALDSFAAGPDGWVALSWSHGAVVVKHGEKEAARFNAPVGSIFTDGKRVAWLDSNTGNIVVMDLTTRKRHTLATALNAKTRYACSGSIPHVLTGLDATSVSARAESGDVGCVIAYALDTGRQDVVSSWSPGEDVDEGARQKALCKRANLDCQCQDSEPCEAFHATQVGPLVTTATKTVRIDEKTGAAVIELAGGPTPHLASSTRTPYVLDTTKGVRVWDARDGRLVWSSSSSDFCEFGIRLYRVEVCP